MFVFLEHDDVVLYLLIFIVDFDNAWMISGLKLSSTLPKVANKP